MVKLSLVVPCYNEGENVIPFHEAALNAFQDCGYEIEIVYIDDGSRDATLHNLKKVYARKDCRVKIVSFSRNFGKEAGIYAGLQHASGEYISLIDADLQQRPEIVRDMVNILDGKTGIRHRGRLPRPGAMRERSSLSSRRASIRLSISLSKVTLQPDASDFRTFRRSVRDSILELTEYHRFSKGIFAWVG